MYISDYYSATSRYWNYPGFSINGESYDYRAAMDNNWMCVVLNVFRIVQTIRLIAIL